MQVTVTEIWAPVVAALGASALTAVASLGVVALQRRWSNRDAALQEQASAYDNFLAQSMAFALRVRWAGEAARLRSGLQEGISVAFFGRPIIEPMTFFDWVASEFKPFLQSWTRVMSVGSQAAINAANDVLNECNAYVEAVMAIDLRKRRVARFFMGERWTPQQLDKAEAALGRLFDAREDFTAIVRQETGRSAAVLPSAARRAIDKGPPASRDA